MEQDRIRNFAIIAHIDHGKSTLADRILELTGALSAREMREQVLDSMELERERGITIKAQAVRVLWRGHELNLIDTPGHVDFTYEVARSLQACEGALLLVDAAQGIQAQTLANAYLALEGNLDIVPVVNKIDLPQADPDGAAAELAELLGEDRGRVLRISAKTGAGVADVLDAIVERIPSPAGDPGAAARALVFDSSYDQYRGVIAFVRVVDGRLPTGAALRAMATGTDFEAEELGFMAPGRVPVETLEAGEVGYVVTGLKDVSRLRVGDTLTLRKGGATIPLPGYKDVKPMVFAGLFPTDSDDYPELRDALEKLKLNDGALFYEPETSQALGFGFRCGFLGLLHMEIVRERLEREFDLDLLVTAPNVAYRVLTKAGEELEERILPLAAHQVVHVRGVHGGVGIHGGEVAAPGDGHLREAGADRGGDLDRRRHLGPGHDAHPHQGARVPGQGGEDGGRRVGVHVAVHDLVLVAPLEHRPQGEERERQPHGVLGAEARVDQDDAPGAHRAATSRSPAGAAAGARRRTAWRRRTSAPKSRAAATESSMPRASRAARRPASSPWLDRSTSARPSGARCSGRAAAKRSGTSRLRQAASRRRRGSPRKKGGLKRTRSNRRPMTGAKRSPRRTSIRSSRPFRRALARAQRTASGFRSTAVTA